MNGRVGVRIIPTVIFIVAFFLSPPARAQDDTGESKGINSGDYNIHQSIEFGYRLNEVTGNQNTYDTFENLGSGLRLFNFNFEMRSLDHHGFFFDTLSLSSFGYGGDPNDVTRLRIEKNKWYDFRMLFRRDKNFWDYNLSANPYNPAALNPSRVVDDGLLRRSAYGRFSAGSSRVLLESRCGAEQFPARYGSGAPDAGLRSHFAAASEGELAPGLFAQSR